MTSHEILKADLLDILFDNRNKQYGAYTLRKNYERRLAVALAVALSSVLLLLYLMKPTSSFSTLEEPGIIETRIIDIQPDNLKPPPPPLPTQPTLPVARRSYIDNIRMVANPDPARFIAPVEEIRGVILSTDNIDGSFVPEIQTVAPVVTQVISSTTAPGTEVAFDPIEKEPEFPGGRQAWINFLYRHLQTPEELEAGEKKMVLVRFMVDADGSVNGFQVVQSGGYQFDNEVIRVLKKMPKWKPAIQNGQAVAVPFSQPVTFVGVEQ